MLTREQILSRTPKRQVVEVPEWNDSVTIQALTIGTAQSLTSEDNILDIVMASCINEDGSPLFSPEDKETLRRQMSLASAKRIAEAAMTLNGITKEAAEALTKNSEPGPNGASSSA